MELKIAFRAAFARAAKAAAQPPHIRNDFPAGSASLCTT